MRRKVLVFSARAAVVITAATTAACGSESSSPATSGSGAGGGNGPTTTVLHPDAPPLPGETACTVTITSGIPIAAAQHVPVCTPVDYATNPPSGGDHWPYWADFREYDAPVPREMYVHDMEHGAVVLAYRCDGACPDVVAALKKTFEGVATDPLCVPNGVNARMVLTPDPKLDAPIAAAAWGATYVATCIDQASLASFVADHYGRGPETLCAPGLDLSTSGPPACDDGGM